LSSETRGNIKRRTRKAEREIIEAERRTRKAEKMERAEKGDRSRSEKDRGNALYVMI